MYVGHINALPMFGNNFLLYFTTLMFLTATFKEHKNEEYAEGQSIYFH